MPFLRAVGQRVAKDLLSHLSTDTIDKSVFPDGGVENLYDFFAGLEDNLARQRFLPLWSGGANTSFNVEGPTYRYCDDEVVSDGVSYALLSAEAHVAWPISHTLIPIGDERIVTRSQGVIY